MKKLLLAIGSATTVIIPVATVVACGDAISVTIPKPTQIVLASMLKDVTNKNANPVVIKERKIVFIESPAVHALVGKKDAGNDGTNVVKESYWDLVLAYPGLSATLPFKNANIVGIKEQGKQWEFFIIGIGISKKGTKTILAEGIAIK